MCYVRRTDRKVLEFGCSGKMLLSFCACEIERGETWLPESVEGVAEQGLPKVPSLTAHFARQVPQNAEGGRKLARFNPSGIQQPASMKGLKSDPTTQTSPETENLNNLEPQPSDLS